MDGEKQLRILEVLEENPETTQASLAAQLGVAVGSVNWYLKRMVRKGYVKVTHMQRRKLKYFVTPQGLALKARLTSEYMEASLRMYRELRRAAKGTLAEIRRSGYDSVEIADDNEAAEIFRLTCLEMGIKVVRGSRGDVPLVRVDGKRFFVEWRSGNAG